MAESYHQKAASLLLLRPSITCHLTEMGYALWFELTVGRQWEAEALWGKEALRVQREVPRVSPTPGPKTVKAGDGVVGITSRSRKGLCCGDSCLPDLWSRHCLSITRQG